MEKEDYFKVVQIFNDAYDKADNATIMLMGIENTPHYQYKDLNALKRLKEIIGGGGEFNRTALEIASIIDPDGVIINQANINTGLIKNAFHAQLNDPDSAVHKIIMESDRPASLTVKMDRLEHLAYEMNKLVREI